MTPLLRNTESFRKLYLNTPDGLAGFFSFAPWRDAGCRLRYFSSVRTPCWGPVIGVMVNGNETRSHRSGQISPIFHPLAAEASFVGSGHSTAQGQLRTRVLQRDQFNGYHCLLAPFDVSYTEITGTFYTVCNFKTRICDTSRVLPDVLREKVWPLPVGVASMGLPVVSPRMPDSLRREGSAAR